ncbi:methyltransferase [Paucibacter aquatile]|uniref:Methyltransferase n=1 Tax=Kinneretia aquatilis TaxID=2070761 RepID=A0A2N8KTC4_9BURK|nr:major capsid protein [Paucibacter aquatile]PND36611.1 methyltransferase [Paucibacter aquatile]PND36707.1 methyltransferase [Paucibacter aquatile]PND36713.1 methyltransferase [Paucibacter aquatile]
MNKMFARVVANKKARAGLVAVGSLVGSTASHAAIDTTAAVATITEAGAAVLVIGLAVFGVVVATKVFKWMARAA